MKFILLKGISICVCMSDIHVFVIYDIFDLMYFYMYL